jgi:hypothetical protein
MTVNGHVKGIHLCVLKNKTKHFYNSKIISWCVGLKISVKNINVFRVKEFSFFYLGVAYQTFLIKTILNNKRHECMMIPSTEFAK